MTSMFEGPGGSRGVRIFKTVTNGVTHVLAIFIVITCYILGFNGGTPLGATPLHIVLCVTGYHLLMTQAILSLSPENIWSARLGLVNKRRAHWILQTLGAGLAIAGSFIKILDKTAHWETYHGQFALVALVFTTFTLVNGVASLWAYEFRRFLPPKLSKVTHICFGIVAFSAATISLCYGIDKNYFKNWSNEAFSGACIVITAIFATIIIINPFISFFNRLFNRNP